MRSEGTAQSLTYACQAHIGIGSSVPSSVPKRRPRTIIRQTTPTKPPMKKEPCEFAVALGWPHADHGRAQQTVASAVTLTASAGCDGRTVPISRTGSGDRSCSPAKASDVQEGLQARRSPSALLHAQRLERIDAGRAARGNPAREERHANHEHRHER